MLRSMTVWGCLALAIAAVPGAAHAHSAADLHANCAESYGSSARIACLSYLHGIIDGLAAANTLSESGTAFRYCPPRGEISVDELRLIFLARIDAGTAKFGTDAGIFLVDALLESFPCPPAT